MQGDGRRCQRRAGELYGSLVPALSSRGRDLENYQRESVTKAESKTLPLIFQVAEWFAKEGGLIAGGGNECHWMSSVR